MQCYTGFKRYTDAKPQGFLSKSTEFAQTLYLLMQFTSLN